MRGVKITSTWPASVTRQDKIPGLGTFGGTDCGSPNSSWSLLLWLTWPCSDIVLCNQWMPSPPNILTHTCSPPLWAVAGWSWYWWFAGLPHEMEQGSVPLAESVPGHVAPWERRLHQCMHKNQLRMVLLHFSALPCSTGQSCVILQNSRSSPTTEMTAVVLWRSAAIAHLGYSLEHMVECM